MSTEPRTGGGTTLTPKRILVLAILALAVIFVIQNADSGRVTLLFWDLTMPGWLWMAVLFLAGVTVGSVFPWFRKRAKT